MKRDIEALMAAMTLEEKASLCSGQDFWRTKAVERLGIPSWMMTDGPHGLRKQQAHSDHLGLNESVPATCFPSGAALAASWNGDLVEEVGRALGEESKAEGVGVILGPAVNIKRSPLCGRNFEYFSEDPYLAGEMAAHHIKGVQSKGVGTSIKHFAANNQEKRRLLIDTVVDERTLREIYLPAFEQAVKDSQPWTVMCSYNKINGTYASENRWLLTRILKEEWGHTGLVVTDWGAANDRVAGLAAGCELEMPGNDGLTDKDIVAAVEAGTLPLSALDAAVRRLLDLTFKVVDNQDPTATYDVDAHHVLARRVATECMVLLKNEGRLLPLRKEGRVAFIGSFAVTPRYQGGGSSHINPTRMDSALEEARSLLGASCSISYAPGYSMQSDDPDDALIAEACSAAAAADVAVLFIGLSDRMESEGFDRDTLAIPEAHHALLRAVSAVQKRVVVVLSNGSPIEMPWLDDVPALLEGYLGGQAWGGAVVDLLFGFANPSGKLAETFPRRLEDTPSFLNFPGDSQKVEYREGIFVGYRYYDAAKVAPLFPFGFGLSYTEFEYSNLALHRASMRDDETLNVSVTIENRGPLAGSEVVQVYVGDVESSVLRPVRELKAFAKISLEAGERKVATFTLERRAFAFWSEDRAAWTVEPGDFEIFVGSSSADLPCRAVVHIDASPLTPRHWDYNATIQDLQRIPAGAAFAEKAGAKFLASLGAADEESPLYLMMNAMLKEMPLRNLIRMGRSVSPEEAEALLDDLNGSVKG